MDIILGHLILLAYISVDLLWSTQCSMFHVDPETIGLKVPFVNLFVDDIVKIEHGVNRYVGRVKFGKHFLGESKGFEFDAFGFFVEVNFDDGITIHYAINESGVKFEKIGNVHDNPEIKLTMEVEE